MSPAKGRITLCLLPGLDGTGRLYSALAVELSAYFDIQVLDYPADELGGYPRLAEQILARLPDDRPFVLVAESFAGPLSVLVAARQPQQMRGLVIAASFLRQPVTQASALARLLEWIPPALRPPQVVLEAVLMGGWQDPRVSKLLASSLSRATPAVLKSRLVAAMRVDVRKEFDRIAVPVLYLRATRDRLLRKAVCRDFSRAARPPLQIDLVAPHFVYQAIAPQAARQIRGFVAGLDCSEE